MSHTYSSIFFHLVWSTKNREPYIKKEFKEKLYYYIAKVITQKKLT